MERASCRFGGREPVTDMRRQHETSRFLRARERYETRIVGSEMQACAGLVPNGWALVSTDRDAVRCGSIDPAYQNVMIIRRMH